MEVLFIVALGMGGLTLASWILPWLNRARIRRLEEQVGELSREVARLRASGAEEGAWPLVSEPLRSAPMPQPVRPDGWETPSGAHFVRPTKALATPRAPQPPRSSPRFAPDFAAKLPIWIGGVALALAGLFLVQYSIQEGWLSPLVRTLLAFVFGCLLIGAGRYLETKHDTRRVVQALWGAGIAVLYGALFAATGLYALMPHWLGFAGMAGLTCVAVSHSLRLGPPIALLGLAGGMLAPMLVGGEPLPSALLYVYLFALVAGMGWTARRVGWWWLELAAMLLGFVWITDAFTANEPLSIFWASLFLLGSAVVLLAPMQKDVVRRGEAWFWVKIVTLLGGLFLLVCLSLQQTMSLPQWAVMVLASAGGLVLAWRQPEIYRHLPWLLLAVMVGLLCAGTGQAPTLWLGYLLILSLLFAAAPLYIGRVERKAEWALLGAISSVGLLLLGYAMCARVEIRPTAWGDMGMLALPSFWGAIALFLAGMAAELTRRSIDEQSSTDSRRLLAVHAGMATALVAIAAGIVLERQMLGIALAGEVLGLAWLAEWLRLPVLRRYAAGVAGLFALVLLPQIALMVQLAVYSTTEIALPLQESLPMLRWPLIQLGIPAACFGGAAWRLSRAKEDRLVRMFELVAVILTMLCGYYLMRHAMDPAATVIFRPATFLVRGVLTNLCFLYGLGLVFFGMRHGRSMLRSSGNAFLLVGLARVVFFDLLTHNPVWSTAEVGSWPLLNGLWLPYGLPILWLALGLRLQPDMAGSERAKWARMAMFGLGWVLLSMQIRHFFHGTGMHGVSGQLEQYCYSIGWLIYGALLLVGGIRTGRKALRVAGMAMLALTVAKVFLLDAANLTGLWRVFSFLALGLSLLGLGYLYGKLNNREAEE